MRIREREVDGVTVLDLSGDLHGGPENMALIDRLEELGRSGRLDVVLDLKKVGFIASNGLGIMLRARARFARHGGEFRLCGASNRALSLLTVTRLHLIFDVHTDCCDALAAFQGRAALAPVGS